MTDTDPARAAILARIRSALQTRPGDAAREALAARRLAEHPIGTVPARAKRSGEALTALLAEMLASSGAEPLCVDSPEAAVEAILRLLEAHDATSLRLGRDPVLAGLPWHLAGGIGLRHGAARGGESIALSRAFAAAAETGTLFLLSGPDNPTSLNFLPETHIVLVQGADVVGCYEEAWDRLRRCVQGELLPRMVNLVSGPSRTADIEQTIIRGAHGPRRLHVVILREQNGTSSAVS